MNTKILYYPSTILKFPQKLKVKKLKNVNTAYDELTDNNCLITIGGMVFEKQHQTIIHS